MHIHVCVYRHTDLLAFSGVEGGGAEPAEMEAGEVLAAVQPRGVVVLLCFGGDDLAWWLCVQLGCVYVCRCGFSDWCEGEWS